MLEVHRTYRFCSSHRLAREGWTPEQNRAAFGTASEDPGHGHNYRMTVILRGEPDPETGCLVDLGTLDVLVEREVVNVYDHRNVNVDVPTMKGKVTTTENIAKDCYERLRPLLGEKLAEVHLRSDEFFLAVYRGD